MDAILTHENADFDALAALLAAKKVYPEALAVLPHRLNRNVRDFITLYAEALALTRQEDLPRRHLSDVLVVDTQGLPSTRGLSPTTRIHIVDHHPLAHELKKGMTFSGGEAGATTTLFVDEIRDKGLPITPIEATLFVLGIYEDTGSLSYVTTTPRDVRAVAFLLEAGARLSVVNDFLHHPLTDSQHKLYQQLLEHLEIIESAGHPIALATARAEAYTEEISTLAHQLRELYDPAALFVFVHMEDHIQMVARSETEAIDVAEIAEAFGGGGHNKAAAAVIRGQTLKQVKTRLLELLRTAVKPTTTVRQLMSYGVHTLEPTNTVAEAAEMMHRYGHEGFPVVRRGKLVGVLTRQEIDRAAHHKMANTPIAELMHPPAWVSPEDSLEKLRAVMIESDLGQVPVVENKQILGIVTRTDLIRQWNAAQPSRSVEIATRLEQCLPPDLMALVREASEAARELGYSLYLVGGFVRDLILNQPNLDLDLVVEGDAIALARRLEKKHGGRVHGHTRFGTAKWILDPREEPETAPGRALAPLYSLDLTTARTEFYAHPSALPEVEQSSIKQDLKRRDFTINTLAICLDPERYGQLLDPFGGEQDLQRGWIRVLHSLSFVEDPTRMLRAVRLEQRLGFKIEARTAELISNALELVHRVSGERIKHELALIFRESEPVKPMARLNQLGILKAIFERLEFDAWTAEKFRAARESLPVPAPLTYFGLLAYRFTPEVAVDFALRLRLANGEAKGLLRLLMLRDQVAGPLAAPDLTPSDVAHLLGEYTDPVLAIFALAVDDERVKERVRLFQSQWRAVTPELTGDDLKRMGIRPGPVYRQILGRLRDARLNGEISSRAQEEEIVNSFVEPSRPRPPA